MPDPDGREGVFLMAPTISEVAARRYARALIDIAVADGLGDRCVQDLEKFRSAVATVPDAREMFDNPTVPVQVLKASVDEIAERLDLAQTTRAFLSLLVVRRRLGGLGRIIDEYRGIQDEIAGRIRGKVRAAGPVGQDMISAISTRLGERVGKKLVLTGETDDRLIGGLQVIVGDRVYDLSTRTWLDSLRTRLLQNR